MAVDREVRRLFVGEGLPEGAPEFFALSPSIRHYASTVLRLTAGANVEAFDARGRMARGVLTSDAGTLGIVVAEWSVAEPTAGLALCVALLKGAAWDRLLVAATEVGYHRIQPLLTERTVPKWREDKASNRLRRWAAIAGESARQCERNRVPLILPPLALTEYLSATGDGAEEPSRVVLAARREGPMLSQWVRTRPPEGAPNLEAGVTVVSGPEGGFTEGELAALESASVRPVSLTSRILRAETAPIVAAAVIQAAIGEGAETLAQRS